MDWQEMASPETKVLESGPDPVPSRRRESSGRIGAQQEGTGSHCPGSLPLTRHHRGQERGRSREWTAEDTRRGPARRVAGEQPHPGPKKQPELAQQDCGPQEPVARDNADRLHAL